MSHNFRLLHVSNLSIRNFRIFCSCMLGIRRMGEVRRDTSLGDACRQRAVRGSRTGCGPFFFTHQLWTVVVLGPESGAGGRSAGVLRRGSAQPPRPEARPSLTPDTCAEKFESLELFNVIRETNGSFASCMLYERLRTSRLPDLHETKPPFVSLYNFPF